MRRRFLFPPSGGGGSEMEFHSNNGQNKKKNNKKNQYLTAPILIGRLAEELLVWRLSMCNPYTYLSVPV